MKNTLFQLKTFHIYHIEHIWGHNFDIIKTEQAYKMFWLKSQMFCLVQRQCSPVYLQKETNYSDVMEGEIYRNSLRSIFFLIQWWLFARSAFILKPIEFLYFLASTLFGGR